MGSAAAFMVKMILDFCIAFGVVMGGTILGGIGAFLSLQPPTDTMLRISEQIKIWAIVAAIGGTIDPIRVIETNFVEGHLSPAIKQILLIICAFFGASIGCSLVQWLCRGGGEP